MFKKVASTSVLLLITACTSTTVDPLENTVSSSSQITIAESSSSSIAKKETRTGIIKPVGITIYMQGTHKLDQTDSAELLLLESDTVDLNGYVNESVQISGVISSTVEANGLIMNVESIQLAEETSSSSSQESQSSVDESELSVDEVDSLSSVVSISADSSMAMQIEEEEYTQEDIEGSFNKNDINTVLIAEFKSYDYAPENWTQDYCSRLAPFCLKFHRNWWYQSFGATMNELNRLEISNKELNSIGDGVIIVRLLAGTTNLDGRTETHTGITSAYRTLDANRYFIIEGPTELQSAIVYLADTITYSE